MHQQRALPLKLGIFITYASYSENPEHSLRKSSLQYQNDCKTQCYVNK